MVKERARASAAFLGSRLRGEMGIEAARLDGGGGREESLGTN
jgi:hypothetical protein